MEQKDVENMDEREGEVLRTSMKNLTVGILRLEATGPRRTSLERHLTKVEPTSPQPSVDRLSVTFAQDSPKSEPSTKFNPNNSPVTMDKVHFPQPTDEENSDDEDYSASVTAIIQRRASTRCSRKRTGRRTSSPFSPDLLPGMEAERRRSSCYTTSSGDTAISMEDNLPPEVTQNEILENIRLHKEVLSSVKMQPWPMSKKLKLVVQAKTYIKKHEGVLQERLAKSRSTRDMIARCKLYLLKKWQRAKREAENLSNWVIPWEVRIKEIESHFGSAVASYFTFLRWLFWVNLVTSVILIAFVAVPEMLTADQKAAGDRKLILQEDKYNATNFATLWDFEGIFKYSPLFYGWYTNRDASEKGYRLPLAYFMTGLGVYVYSFVATLRKMAENSRMSKLSEKEDECVFSWKLFTGWDYMIGNAETAHNRVASIVMGFKEALLEEAEKKKDNKNWKIIGLRVLVNVAVVALLVMSAFAVVEVVRRSTEPEAKSSIWRMNETTVVMNLISFTFPIIFEILGLCEQYHPRKQLRIQLARIMLLNLLNIYSLIFALYDKIDDMQVDLQTFKINRTTEKALDLNSNYKSEDCYKVCDDVVPQLEASNLISSFLSNVSAFVLPAVILTGSNFSTSIDYQTSNSVSTEFTFDNVTVDPAYTVTNSVTILSESETIQDFEQAFEDYRDFIASNFQGTTFSNVADFYNASSTESYFVPTSTLEESFERFKTTFAPFFNVTSEDLEERFRTEYDVLVENVTSTYLNSTAGENCRFYCESFAANDSNLSGALTEVSYKSRSKLRSLCWETMFGQEIVKLTVMDFVMMILSTLAMDFFRGVFVRVMNNCWCWDLEKKFPQYGDFKVAENILHLINNQGVVWMGMFFSPGLIVLNTFKLYIIVYFRSWAVLTCNVPHKIVFRASRSNNFYYALLLSMLFLCVLPVGYAIVWVRPSWHCGPFSQYARIFRIFTSTLKRIVPKSLHKSLDYIASPGIVIPLLVLMILVIYYLISLTNALREANNDLKIQLRRERTEERRKMFQLVDRRRNVNLKWKTLLQNLPTGKSFDEPSKKDVSVKPKTADNAVKSKDFLSKFINRAMKKSITFTSDEEIATDSEQQLPSPDDIVKSKQPKPQVAATFKRPDFKSIQRASTDSTEKRVKIAVNDPQKLHKHDKKRQCRSPSTSSTWSDNIPVITINKIETAKPLPGCSFKELRGADERQLDGSSETLVGDNFDERHKHLLRKQRVTEVEEAGEEREEGGDAKLDSQNIKEGKDRKSTTEESIINSDTKTESSSDYKDTVLS